MKNVFLMLMLFVGVATQAINAQNCSLICPPGCCIKSCTAEQAKNCTAAQAKNCTASASNNAAVSNDATIGATFASFLIAAQESIPSSQAVDTKDAKACLPVCQPACQAKSVSVSKCQASTSSVAASVPSTRVKEKS